jgi:hypothetical protein
MPRVGCLEAEFEILEEFVTKDGWMDGWSMSLISSQKCSNRTARNPHDVTRYTGGSSSGSTALVSSGLCPVALGTDVGGLSLQDPFLIW